MACVYSSWIIELKTDEDVARDEYDKADPPHNAQFLG